METTYQINWKRIAQSLATTHPSMSPVNNPVLALGENADKDRLQFVLGQYFFLPALIVAYLSTGANRLDDPVDWKNTNAELKRNIAEELGSRTSGISHYQLLVQGLQTELGLTPSGHMHPVTQRFVAGIWELIYQTGPTVVSGVVYALEDSAVPELRIVAQIINSYAQAVGKNAVIRLEREIPLPTEGAFENLEQFFRRHIYDFEAGHQSLLKAAIQKDHDLYSPFVQRNMLAELETGYEKTLNLMDEWWQNLAATNAGLP